MGNTELSEIKSEIRKLKRKMKKNVQNNDIDKVQEDFYAIMDGYDKMREHLKQSCQEAESSSEGMRDLK